MNHQPFDTWLVDEITLTPEQKNALQAHLESCSECRQLKSGWQAARDALQTSPLARPASGFSQRFTASLAEHRARAAHRQQVKRLIVILSLGLLASIILLGVVVFSFASPVDILVKGAGTVTGIVAGFNRLEKLVLSALQSPLALGIWIMVTSGISTLVVGWVITLWKISSRGAHRA